MTPIERLVLSVACEHPGIRSKDVNQHLERPYPVPNNARAFAVFQLRQQGLLKDAVRSSSGGYDGQLHPTKAGYRMALDD